MEPLTATTRAIAVRSAESTTPSVHETNVLNGLEITPELETTPEAHDAIIGENGLAQQIDCIKFESMDALAARNEARLSESSQIEKNQKDGAAREDMVRDELERECPTEDGYHIERECPLRDKEGNIVRDPQTDESRRVDFAVIEDGEVVKSVEVTSETADKTAQLEKEARIRDAGGNFIIDRRTGELVPFAPGVKTEIVRRA